jgi:hypothetical protein
VRTVGLDEAKGRKYIQKQDENELIEGRWMRILGDPF